jgi:hypothetical protein
MLVSVATEQEIVARRPPECVRFWGWVLQDQDSPQNQRQLGWYLSSLAAAVQLGLVDSAASWRLHARRSTLAVCPEWSNLALDKNVGEG